jgi:hypothetical protein
MNSFNPRDRKILSLIMFFTAIIYGLFFFRTSNSGDYPVHLQLAQDWENGTLQMPHFLFHLSLILVHQIFSVSYPISLGIVLTLTMLVVVYLIFRYLRMSAPTLPTRYIANGTLALIFWGPASVLIVPYGILLGKPFPEIRLIGYHTSYPLHNPTTMAILPFALLLFWLCMRIIENNKISYPLIALIAFLTIYSTLIKPNYTIAIVPAICLYALLNRQKVQIVSFIFGLVIPALLALTWQYFFWFDAPTNTQGGFAIAPFAVLLQHGDRMLLSEISPYLAILKGAVLSFLYVFVLFKLYNPIRDQRVQVALLITLVALVQGYLFVEKNDLWSHGNFLWGVRIANFILPVVMTGYLLQQMALHPSKPLHLWIKLTYLVHIVSGLAWLVIYIVLVP